MPKNNENHNAKIARIPDGKFAGMCAILFDPSADISYGGKDGEKGFVFRVVNQPVSIEGVGDIIITANGYFPNRAENEKIEL